ncbi:Sec-independent protein translocase subunit TatA [Rhodococcus sp. OK302]|uniref:Sec-independent protein translocase subunit TatA n=1 Tax=Rhodococcus sp. OK302 TaxID=1882769 RepID=UPI000B93EEA6|nr:Sec-independent protein translocase subunit TatA [Rhodococcus sp. OK302]OYD71850.1 sec-independent protein translocase protein TatA [Rhodococcus sp. OK302]
MGALSPTHWAIVAVVLLVLFGSKKLPDAARGLGRSMRILKTEVGELHSGSDLALDLEEPLSQSRR